MKPGLLLVHFTERLHIYNTPTLHRHYAVHIAPGLPEAMASIARDRPACIIIWISTAGYPDPLSLQPLRTYGIPLLVLFETYPAPTLLRQLAVFTPDYLVHPVRSQELIERLAVILAHRAAQSPPPPTRIVAGSLQLDFTTHQVWQADVRLALTPTEWMIVELLVRAEGALVSYVTIRRHIWGDTDAVTDQTLRTHVLNLRRKLRTAPDQPDAIVIERGLGARFAGVLTAAAGMRHTPALQPHDLPLFTIPARRNAFIGRADALARLCAALGDPTRRLITMTGVAGVGKTSLAQEAGRASATIFPDGVAFVALATLHDGERLLPTIAQALGLKEEAQPLATALIDFLRPRTLLLILDNVDALVDALPVIATLLDAAPGLHIVTTSRIAPQLSAQVPFTLDPLHVPDPTVPPDRAALAAVEAIDLFVTRAQTAKASFAFTESNMLIVAEICARLEGLPFSLELAAAQIAMMTPTTLLARLGTRLDVLRQEARDLPFWQQTLRGTIDWSFYLLPPTTQPLLASLSVFVGGWTTAAATAVAYAESSIAVVEDQLLLLRRHSLITVVDGHDDLPRWTMLETIREYAADRARTQGMTSHLRARHAAYFVTYAEQAAPALDGADQQVWLDRLEADHDNLRAALTWGMQEDGDLAARLSGALWRFWWIRGYLAEGRHWLTQAATHPAPMAPAVRALAFHGAGILAQWQGDYSHATMLLTEALTRRRALDAPVATAGTLTSLAFIAQDHGEYVTAQTYLEESLQIYRHDGTPLQVADTLMNLGGLWDDRALYEQARALFSEALSLFEAQGIRNRIAAALGNLGQVARNLGQYDDARRLLQQSLGLRRELGDKAGIVHASINLGIVATLQHQLADARPALLEALNTATALAARTIMVEVVEATTLWLYAGDAKADAATLLLAMTTIRDREDRPRNVTDQQRYQTLADTLAYGLDPTEWALCEQSGRRMSLEAAVVRAQTYLAGDDLLRVRAVG